MKRLFFAGVAGIGLFFLSASYRNPDQTKPKQTKPAQTKQAAISKKTLADGKKIYDTYCLVCHQADGGGVPRLNPPLQKTEFVLGDKTRLINIVLKGMSEEVEIDGEVYDNNMSAHAFLTDQQVSDVLTYVRNNFTNKASAVTPAEVKAVRAKLK
ncbi:cytochrome c [Pseudoflavitalea sp. G-6-1-2]|uniref:c-type cytochrome n=1 Tax=Pseudoflavitalea sp. G-6-1-2 TaxID=2728841 RepID=UPI00146CF205|nr:c-type cytochrome [Pseudoflavitalea sp. G-6-1-2]NML23379.1 cytochrome c [Pseudoflavitalea sp. G-6-1-2]